MLELVDSLFAYFKKNDKNAHIDESDSLIFSLGLFLLFFGLVSFGSSLYEFKFSKYIEVPNTILLGISIFSLYFLLVMKLEKGSRKSVLIILTFPLVTLISLFFYEVKADLDQANNGLSLIALSLTLLFMPLDKLGEKSEERRKELREQFFSEREDARYALIEELTEENGELHDTINGLLDRNHESVVEIGKLKANIAELNDQLKQLKV